MCSIIKAKITQYEKDIQTLKEALAENKEDEREKNEELEKNTVTFHLIVHPINKYKETYKTNLRAILEYINKAIPKVVVEAKSP